MKAILIREGRIVDPSQNVSEISNILIADGKIVWWGQGEPKTEGTAAQEALPLNYGVLRAAGLTVCPGFIDLHCHLRDPGFEEKETITTGTRAAAKGGFTTVCCMPNTEPPLDNRSVIEYVKEKARTKGAIRVLPIGCITKGRKGEALAEMGELTQAGVIGFSDDGNSVANSRLMRQALDYSRAFNLPIIEHCEDKTLVEGGQMNEGIIATRLGLAGMPAAAEESIVARDISLAELTGAKLHIAHVSSAGSVELIRRAKEKGIKITAEVTPHHLTLTEEVVMGYETNAKVNPPLRTKADIQALLAGLKDNVIDAIATDHAPHTEVEKLSEFASAPFGICVLETALGSLMGLVHGGQLNLDLVISKLTCEPAAILDRKFGKLGTLKVGSTADVTLIDPDKEWVVDPKDFASKGKNTPLAGQKLKGKVVGTFYGGKPVYLDESIKGGINIDD
jgi:dihydroorotase